MMFTCSGCDCLHEDEKKKKKRPCTARASVQRPLIQTTKHTITAPISECAPLRLWQKQTRLYDKMTYLYVSVVFFLKTLHGQLFLFRSLG